MKQRAARAVISCTIKQGKPEMVTPKDYLKAMSQWSYIVTSKVIANRFRPAARRAGAKVKLQTLSHKRVKVIKVSK